MEATQRLLVVPEVVGTSSTYGGPHLARTTSPVKSEVLLYHHRPNTTLCFLSTFVLLQRLLGAPIPNLDFLLFCKWSCLPASLLWQAWLPNHSPCRIPEILAADG